MRLNGFINYSYYLKKPARLTVFLMKLTFSQILSVISYKQLIRYLNNRCILHDKYVH